MCHKRTITYPESHQCVLARLTAIAYIRTVDLANDTSKWDGYTLITQMMRTLLHVPKLGTHAPCLSAAPQSHSDVVFTRRQCV